LNSVLNSSRLKSSMLLTTTTFPKTNFMTLSNLSSYSILSMSANELPVTWISRFGFGLTKFIAMMEISPARPSCLWLKRKF